MKVEIINPEEVKNIYKNHGIFACTCYNTPDKHAEKVGKQCLKADGHTSGSRCEYIKFRLYDMDRGVAEQFMRHEIGVRYDEVDKYTYSDRIEIILDINPCNIVKNMQSFRYVDKNEFKYTIPTNIKKSTKALEKYNNLMSIIDDTRKEIRDILIEEQTKDREFSKEQIKKITKQAVEDANYVLPRATNLTLTIAFTPEALIQFMWKRLCTRTQDMNRKFAIQMKNAVAEINPTFAKELKPHCQHLLWCPEENMSCGMKPTKKELEQQLKGVKNNA